MQHGVARHWVA